MTLTRIMEELMMLQRKKQMKRTMLSLILVIFFHQVLSKVMGPNIGCHLSLQMMKG